MAARRAIACVVLASSALARGSQQEAAYTLRHIALGSSRHMRLRIPTKASRALTPLNFFLHADALRMSAHQQEEVALKRAGCGD
eukprot:459040-Pleurochrysis_carterae.AAC.4